MWGHRTLDLLWALGRELVFVFRLPGHGDYAWRRQLWREAASAAGLARVDEGGGVLVGWSGSVWVRLASFAARLQ